MKKINEIFYSLQGEGHHTGVPSVFVRFSGCNKHCWFCDTLHEEGNLMSDEDIAEEINCFDAKWIVLTGGEPSLWIDAEFVKFLKHKTGKKIAIETNGSLPVPEEIDWVTVSPKIGVEGAGQYDINVTRADEIKAVDLGQPLDIYKSMKCVTPSTVFSLQPCFTGNPDLDSRNLRSAIARVLENPDWCLSLQTHRLLGIR